MKEENGLCTVLGKGVVDATTNVRDNFNAVIRQKAFNQFLYEMKVNKWGHKRERDENDKEKAVTSAKKSDETTMIEQK